MTTESEQLSNRDKMIDLINEQCNLTRLADNVDVLIQVCRGGIIISKNIFLNTLGSKSRSVPTATPPASLWRGWSRSP